MRGRRRARTRHAPRPPGGRRARLRRLLAAGLLPALGLGACALASPPPPVEDSRLVAGSPQQVLDRARQWLRAQDFAIRNDHRRRDGGRLQARRTPFDEGGYARCAWTFALSGGAHPEARVDVQVRRARPGWTHVQARVDISLVNGFGDRAACASRGRLEREILAAVSSAR